MKKIFKISIIIYFFMLSSCGFSPILKNVNLENVKISKIDYSGSSDLVYFLRSNLNIPITKNANNGYKIKIFINEGTTSVTKDTAGVTTEERITIGASLEIISDKNKIIGTENLSESKTISVTNNISTDSELKRIEKENLMTSLIQQLTFAIRAKIATREE